MQDIKGAVVSLLFQARNDIQANLAAKGINASGRTSASFGVRETPTGFALVGGGGGTHAVPLSPKYTGFMQAQDTAPIPTLEIGRPAGKVPRGLYYILKQWSREKGIPFAKESERQTFAYFLSRKIAREGTQRHKQHVDVYSTVAQKTAAEIQKNLTMLVSTEITQVIKRNF